MNPINVKKIIAQLQDHEKRIFALEINKQSIRKNYEKIETTNSDDLILLIVNKVGDCEESEEMQTKILDQRSAEGKILLCFYISYKYFKNIWLNTGNIEEITSNLGVKIDVRNVTNKISELRRYLESGSIRKKGQPTPYRLHRKGFKRFNEILHGTKTT